MGIVWTGAAAGVGRIVGVAGGVVGGDYGRRIDGEMGALGH